MDTSDILTKRLREADAVRFARVRDMSKAPSLSALREQRRIEDELRQSSRYRPSTVAALAGTSSSIRALSGLSTPAALSGTSPAVRALSRPSAVEMLADGFNPVFDAVGASSISRFAQNLVERDAMIEAIARPAALRVFEQMEERSAMLKLAFGPIAYQRESRPSIMPVTARPTERDVLLDVRDEVEAYLQARSPLGLRRLEGAHAAIVRGDEESLAQAAMSCRRAIVAIADEVSPPSDGVHLDRQGRELKLGPQEFRNRLVVFFEARVLSKSRRRGDIEDLDALMAKLKRLVEDSSKGVHADVELAEARRIYLATIEMLAEIARHDFF